MVLIIKLEINEDAYAPVNDDDVQVFSHNANDNIDLSEGQSSVVSGQEKEDNACASLNSHPNLGDGQLE